MDRSRTHSRLRGWHLPRTIVRLDTIFPSDTEDWYRIAASGPGNAFEIRLAEMVGDGQGLCSSMRASKDQVAALGGKEVIVVDV